MSLLLGCKVEFEDRSMEGMGIIVKVDGQQDGSYCWVLLDSGDIRIMKTRYVTVSEGDINFIKEFSDNRIKRLKMMGRSTPISREELIDLD